MIRTHFFKGETMEKENKAMTIVTYANLVLIGLCIIGCLYGITVTKSIYFMIDAVVEIIALIASITYFAMGYKKDAAKYYKMFMLLQAATYIVEYLISTYLDGIVSTTGIFTAFSLILYGNTLMLGLAKDLGKKATIGIASFNLAIYAATFIGSFFSEKYVSAVEKTDTIIMAATWFALAGITLLMTIAKYVDKSKRNTK